jgi:hypothetical protein
MATRAALTAAEHEYIRVRKQTGATLAVMAAELDCSLQTVRKHWRRWRRGQVPRPRGRPARGILSTYPTDMVNEAVSLKQSHPHWGPANVKLELKRRPDFAQTRLPSDARLAVLFRARCPEAVQPRRRQVYPAQPLPKARRPHQRWQVDGQEKIPIGAQDVATVLNVRDPAAALMLASQAVLTTTPKGWRKLTVAEVQETLRTAFSEWGLPLEVQTDHEVVYTGSPASDFPSAFSLWLVGLGLQHMPSRDRRPTDQAQVERNHRTLGDMGWKDEPSDRLEDLQTLLDDRRQRYNTELPVRAADCRGRPPLVAHPRAGHSGRPFDRAWEWDLFDLGRVDAYLAQWVWTRRISEAGNIGIGNYHYYVGRSHLNQTVSVRFVPATRSFRFQLTDGTLVSERAALGLDKVDLIGYMPLDEALLVPWQLPLPLQGV